MENICETLHSPKGISKASFQTFYEGIKLTIDENALKMLSTELDIDQFKCLVVKVS